MLLMSEIKPGVYLVDKPSGPTSHDVVNYFRKRSGIKKVGHCGTLDPLASGLLILLVGRDYTKKQDLYLKKDKEYLVEAKFGTATDSYDKTGKIIKEVSWQQVKELDERNLKELLLKFKGETQQEVPIFSAVKIKGQKLYQKARRGETVDLPKRLVKIKKIVLKSFKKDVKKQETNFELSIVCSSGTYIRSLIHDLGEKTACGACVTALRRIKIDKFHVKKAIKLTVGEIKNPLDS